MPSASPMAANGGLFGSTDDDAAAADDDDAAAAGDDDRLALGMKALNPLPGSSSSFSRACSLLLAISSPIRFVAPILKPTERLLLSLPLDRSPKSFEPVYLTTYACRPVSLHHVMSEL